MRRRPLPMLLLLLTLLLAGACGDDAYSNDDPDPSTDDTTDPEEIDLDDAAVLTTDQRDVQVDVGDLVVVELEENVSVGDDWQVAEAPDVAVLEAIDESYEIDDPETDGGGGTVRFVFEAVGDGGTTMVLHNCFRCDSEGNSSEDSGTPDIEFSVEVTA